MPLTPVLENVLDTLQDRRRENHVLQILLSQFPFLAPLFLELFPWIHVVRVTGLLLSLLLLAPTASGGVVVVVVVFVDPGAEP